MITAAITYDPTAILWKREYLQNKELVLKAIKSPLCGADTVENIYELLDRYQCQLLDDFDVAMAAVIKCPSVIKYINYVKPKPSA